LTALKLDEVHDAMIQSLRVSAAAATPPRKVSKLHLYFVYTCTQDDDIVLAIVSSVSVCMVSEFQFRLR
jgi:hypothetical protein